MRSKLLHRLTCRCRLQERAFQQRHGDRRYRRRFSRRVARNHARCAVFTERTCKGEHDPCQNACAAVGHANAPKDIAFGKSNRTCRIGKRFIKRFKRTACRAVHERENDHRRCQDGILATNTQLNFTLTNELNSIVHSILTLIS